MEGEDVYVKDSGEEYLEFVPEETKTWKTWFFKQSLLNDPKLIEMPLNLPPHEIPKFKFL